MKLNKAILPEPHGEREGAEYGASYVVHEKFNGKFLGLLTVHPDKDPKLPEELEIPAAEASKTLVVELAYLFLPSSWGKGFATESVRAVLDTYRQATSFWDPYNRLLIRAVVDTGNLESIRVLEKVGLEKRGEHKWEGDPIWLASAWGECKELVYALSRTGFGCQVRAPDRGIICGGDKSTSQ